MELDLEKIKKLGEENFEENWDFRSYLKCLEMEVKELDSIVHKIHKEVSSKIDCTECANCCKGLTIPLDEEEIKKFVSGLNITEEEFLKESITIDEDGDKIFKNKICSYLKDDKCTNYECRPKTCSDYPHLHKDGFTFRLIGVVNNYDKCPIVFNVYEILKEHFDFKNDDDDDFFDEEDDYDDIIPFTDEEMKRFDLLD